VSPDRTRSIDPRADKVLPGIWRLRLPLPWPGVPHGNAWLVRSGDGVVMFDTGIGGEGALAGLEAALAQAGFKLSDVKLVACTHSHADHYGLAAPITAASGAELWVHPAWSHVRRMVEDPDGSLDARIEMARQSGVPAAAIEMYRERSANSGPTVDGIVAPDRELVPGVEVETDLGNWQVYETPGHAPSHVVFHQPDRKLMISGDHLLGRVSVFFDYGHTPDPVGEFLGGLETVEPLEADLVLSGHGRPFRDKNAKIAANRELVAEQTDRVRASLASGEKTAFEAVADMVGPENLNPATAAWGLQITLAYLDHLELRGEAEKVDGTDPVRWRKK
jgi:glyoxylase-like metal-dependent hydrolase (beta-lactamase superfamily II)